MEDGNFRDFNAKDSIKQFEGRLSMFNQSSYNLNVEDNKQNSSTGKNHFSDDEDVLNDEKENVKLITKEKYSERIDLFKKQLKEIKSKLLNTIHQQKKELKSNFDKQNKDISKDISENTGLIQKHTLSPGDSFENLCNYSNLHIHFSNIIEQASKNLITFLNDPIPFDKNQTALFMLKHEAELNTINIYGHMTDGQCNKVYNKIQDQGIKKYISKTNYALNKLKIDSKSNIADMKELLASDDQCSINKITVDNISKDDFNYIFCTDIFIINRFKKEKENNPTSEKQEKQEKQEKANSSVNNSPTLKENIKIDVDNNDKNDNKLENSPQNPRNSPNSDTNLVKVNTNRNQIPPPRRESFSSLGSKNKRVCRLRSCIDVSDSDSEVEKKNIEEITIKNCNLENVYLSEIFPNINVLKLYNCKVDFNFYESFNFKTLSELYFDKLNFVDFNLNEIIYKILANDALVQNLRVLSFAKNKICTFNLLKYSKGKIVEFKELKILNLANNKISFFDGFSFNGLKDLKVLDLSYNYLPLRQSYQNMIEILLKKKILILLTGNFALMQKQERKIDYINYLNTVLPKLEYPLKEISLQGLFHGNAHKSLYDFNLNLFKNTLVDINLSQCDITDKDLIDILSKSLCLYNLKKIDVSKNKLTDAILDLSVKNNLHKIFNKLIVINISFNDIRFSNGSITKTFLKSFCTLEYFILKNTPIEEDINNYIKNEIIFYNENKNKKKPSKHNYNEKELLIQELFYYVKDNKKKEEKGYFIKKNCSTKISIRNLLEKSTEAKQLFPEFFERINMDFKILN